ncbi:PREDICTED: thyroid hormone receptor beta-like, partial [Rhagoletis zephyria]|uniref:thyroid hormone receptor beta-like n=1 Tax=Rhagoletis zephyria TaxID=28612 RepID=UPI0008112867
MNKKPVKTCRVCGDFANFTTVIYHKLICFKSNNCVITKETRKECSKCRYEKCLNIGMKTSKTISKSRKQVSVIFKEIENLPRLRQALNKSNTLSNYELQCIKNVNFSFKYFVNESQLNFSDINSNELMENLPIANMQAYIRQMLRYLMRVDLFKSFPKNKQIDIIKHASYAFAAIRCAASYDPVEETYVVFPDETSKIGYKMKANSLHEAIDDKDGLDENMAIVINLNKFMLNDETVTNLISSVSIALSLHYYIKSEYL